MAKSTKDKIFDTVIGMVTRDLTRTALNKFKKVMSDTKKGKKKVRRNEELEDKEEDLEP